MYVVGGLHGLYALLEEVVYNALMEVAGGRADRVRVTLHRDGSVSVADNGAGIPAAPDVDGVPCLTQALLNPLHWRRTHAGRSPYPRCPVDSGLAVVNPLCEWLEITTRHGAETSRQRFEYGLPATQLVLGGDFEFNHGTRVHWMPDWPLFHSTAQPGDVMVYNALRIGAYLRELSRHYAPVSILFHDEGGSTSAEWKSDGLRTWVEEFWGARAGKEAPVFASAQRGADRLDLAWTYIPGSTGEVRTYCNSHLATANGWHLTAFRAALRTVLRSIAEEGPHQERRVQPPDAENGLYVLFSFRLQEPILEGACRQYLRDKVAPRLAYSAGLRSARLFFEQEPEAALHFLSRQP